MGFERGHRQPIENNIYPNLLFNSYGLRPKEIYHGVF